jgi:dTDP-glucose pyrophosphorylase
MINVVVPLAANMYFESSEYVYPKPLIEVRGTPIIQLVLNSLRTLPQPARFIFIISKKDEARFHLSDTFKILTNNQCEIVCLDGQSKGAACSVLMAVNHIQNANPVVIANGDQIFTTPLNPIIKDFESRKLDAGVICFDSVHPRWSYVRLNEQDQVIEAAEKRPISRHAIAGFYYFKRGDEFVTYAMNQIEKGAEVNGQYYVAPILNEYILESKRVGIHKIDNNLCRTFYSIQKIEEAQHDAGL